MWSRNHACRERRELALGRAIPFVKPPEFRTHTFVLIFLLQANNKADTRVLWFSVRKNLVFVLINFMTSLKFEKFDSCQNKKCVLNFWKNTKKNSFSFCLFLEIGWCFILNKKMKNWKNECRIRFLWRNIFEYQTKSGKKNDMSGIKRCR